MHFTGVMKIMIIDDHELAARSICRALREHTTVAETDAKAALARLRSGEWFDAVLCDLRMPGMSGVEVLDEIRSWFGSQAPILVLMTGADASTLTTTEAVLVKPFKKVELEAMLAVLVETRGETRMARTTRIPRVKA